MNYKTLAVGGLSVFTLMAASQAEAGFVTQWNLGYNNYHQRDRHPNRHNHRHYRYPRHSYGKIIWGLPHGSITVAVGGAKYYYDDGIYYQKYGRGYRVAHAPVGACLRRLPRGYKVHRHRGRKYFSYKDVYYQHTPGGYVVISEPFVITEAKNINDAPLVNDEDDPLVVNVPNEDGGYTRVKLTREGKGFVGPQGEYYYEFPKVERLKLIYGSTG